MNTFSEDGKKKILEILFLAAVSGYFIFASTYKLAYVLPDVDETVYGIQAEQIIHNIRPYYGETSLFGIWLPLRGTMNYNFALPAYILAPFFALFGASTWMLKLVPILFGAAGIAAFFYAIKMVFNARIAAISSLLLSTNPLYVFYAFNSLYKTEPLINALFSITILLLLLYVKKRKTSLLVASSFVLGALLSVKLSAVSYYLGLAVVFAFIYRNEAKGLFPRRARVAAAVLSFTAGLIIFILYNVFYPEMNTFRNISLLFSESWQNNLDVFNNLGIRLKHLFWFWGNVDPHYLKDIKVRSIDILLVTFTLFSVAANFTYYSLSGDRRNIKKLASVCVFFGVVFATSIFTPLNREEFHLSLLFPFQQLMIAVFLSNTLFFFEKKRHYSAVKISLSAFLLFLILGQLSNVAARHRMLDSDYRDRVATSVYLGRLSEWMKCRDKPVVALDSNVDTALAMLNNGRLVTAFLITHYDPRRTAGMARKAYESGRGLFLIETAKRSIPGRSFSVGEVLWDKKLKAEYIGSINCGADDRAYFRLYALRGEGFNAERDGTEQPLENRRQ
ncbi:MAG: glycosyltransferase family 39 protein [Endomicrobiales bacterium]|nr:glycosyltransferase family 39 protein [Endomicrobiales bacterium]